VIRAHFDAVMAVVKSAVPVPVHDTDAGDNPGTPYVVVSGGGVVPFSVDVGGSDGEASGLVRVTHTALTASAVRSLTDSTRGVLNGAEIAVQDRHAFGLELYDHQDVTVDRDVKIVSGGTTRFPFFAVDIYRLETTEE
jgi:hypothetical protein